MFGFLGFVVYNVSRVPRLQGQPTWEQIQAGALGHVSLQPVMANMYDYGGPNMVPVHYQHVPVSPADFRTPLEPRQAEMLLNPGLNPASSMQQRHWQSGEEFVACAPVSQTGPSGPGQGLLQNLQEHQPHGRYIGSTVAVTGTQDPEKGPWTPHSATQIEQAGANRGRWYDGTTLSQQLEVLSLGVIQPGEPLQA